MVSARIARAVRTRGYRQPVDGSLGTRSRLLALLAMSVLGLVPMLAWPRAAEAGGAACTGTGLGYLCNQTDSRGLHVGGVHAWLDTRTWTCNKELRVRGTLASGEDYERSAVSPCGWGRVSVWFDVDQEFQNGSYVCVGVREYGRHNPWEPYEACNRIRR